MGELIALLAQLGISIGGELLSNGQRNQGQSERDKADALLRQGLEEFQGIDVPELERLNAQELGPSAYDALSTDPRLADAQYAGLNSLDEVINGNGFSAEDIAYLNQLGAGQQRRAAQTRNAIDNDMAARGMSNSGASVAAKLGAGQQANEAQAQAGQATAAHGLSRRLAAIREKGQLAGNMRGQDFNEGAAKAGANDARSRYNAGARDSANRYNAGLAAQRYGMQLQRAQGMSGQLGGMAGQANRNSAGYDAAADRTQGLYSGLGSAAYRGVNAASNALGGQSTKGGVVTDAYGNQFDDNGNPYDLNWNNPYGGG